MRASAPSRGGFRKAAGLVLVTVFAVALFAAGCSRKPDVIIEEGSEGMTVEIKDGGILAVQLLVQMGTGYTWRLSGKPAGVEQVGDPEVVPRRKDKFLAGGSGTQTFLFKCKGKGKRAFKMVYVRPWEKNVDPAKEFSVTLSVK